MSIRVALNHKTSYRYSKSVWLSPHVVRLRPAPHCRTPVVSYSLRVKPEKHFINWQQDPYNNRLARLVFPEKASEFSVEVDLIAELSVINPFDFFLDKYGETYPFAYDRILSRELIPYLETEPAGPKLQKLIHELRRKNTRTVDYLVELNLEIHRRHKYLIRMEPGIQTPEETLTLQSGSCRDSAWLMVQLLRNLGLAARFVSGYLIQLAPDIKSLDGPSGPDQDVTDLHAWAEVYLPGAGWIGFDPTSGLLAGEGHLPLACSADPSTAAAIDGFYSADDESVVTQETGAPQKSGKDVTTEFNFSMSIARVHEDPRVTKPYSDEQWKAIESLGHRVDADLRAQDVRLTMGGEPTFVSIDDMDGDEWNVTALGPVKYRRADNLARRLRDHFAPCGLLHHGQGKWYPGESLPRWSLGIFWRKDGEPIWRDASLYADEKSPEILSADDAQEFLTSLARRLNVDPGLVIPGYEDKLYYLWKERRLPVNVSVRDNKLANAEERERLARILEEGLGQVVGYALPLSREYAVDGKSKWTSGAWFLRSEEMFLIPGDSPMGYRLPLDSIPWVSESEFPRVVEQDPMEDRPPLPTRSAISRALRYEGVLSAIHRQGIVEQRLGAKGPFPKLTPESASRVLPALPGESAPGIVRTAICAEVRGGVLRVFLPPQHYLEDYLALVWAVEDTAAQLGKKVQIEGYAPPHDPRLNAIKVTPDPGVIEVNTQPADSWNDLVRNTTVLYEEARQCRLGTEKFMMDGRHTGTGGGNHIVVGGPTPADSPLLRNPGLLRSMVGYWHNHPSLSYLFSGLFVGPTSQAPRLDEARNDQVYELEIAFQQVTNDGAVFPWTTDRIFRDLLADATGNTHRAEFCIDKLYSPDGPTGRLGLLEMRAFEMPPHARMSLTQHLLLRSLIARFWKTQYDEKPVRWRTEIHDRFMLPYFVRQDMEDVVREINEFGYAFDIEWLVPHFEFRFPRYGSIEQRGIVLELRQAIEPWNVLGEQPATGGTVRYVDSTLERIQLLVKGMVDPRHVITCNGRRVPLHATGTNGEFVAGVRYRAWQPPNCLHPTIGVHAPLVFDLVDTWSGRSIGGCTYHVVHPGGRNYENFPVNANEAESRRRERFFSFGHTPGPMSVAEERILKEFPYTLDLRTSA
ncbi:MAG TPA: transglutaminase family protein [Candidatus Saccharimonadales bacterium]|nr:transglutaminase family protein [Candidatus Saccharimonadales bacterium]